MGNVITIDPIKDPRWDKFIENHPFGWIVHLSGWKTVLEQSFAQMKGHYLALLDPTNNEIRAALPLFEVRSWLMGNRLVSIPYATLCDPLILNQEELKTLLDEAINFAESSSLLPIKIRTFQSYLVPEETKRITNIFYKTHQLRLSNDPEETKKSFSRNVRRKIKEIDNNDDLHLRIGCDDSDISVFYHLYAKTRKRLGLPSQPYIFLKNLFEVFSAKKQITLLLAEYKGRPIAGLIIYKFKDRVSSEFLASDIEFRDLNLDYFLYWNAIIMACHEDYKIYDFGRTASNNLSLMEFKRKWGTNELDLPQYFYTKGAYAEPYTLESSPFYKLASTVCRYAPEFIYTLIGKFCYRHMG